MTTKNTKPPVRNRAKTPPQPATVSVTFRIPLALKNRCQKIANEDGRSLNNWIAQCVKEAAK